MNFINKITKNNESYLEQISQKGKESISFITLLKIKSNKLYDKLFDFIFLK